MEHAGKTRKQRTGVRGKTFKKLTLEVYIPYGKVRFHCAKKGTHISELTYFWGYETERVQLGVEKWLSVWHVGSDMVVFIFKCPCFYVSTFILLFCKTGSHNRQARHQILSQKHTFCCLCFVMKPFIDRLLLRCGRFSNRWFTYTK